VTSPMPMPNLPINGLAQQQVCVLVTAEDALLAAWRAWLVAHVAESARYDPPQSFEIQDGYWCQWLRPYHAEPMRLTVPASERDAAILAAFRHLEVAFGLPRYLDDQGPL